MKDRLDRVWKGNRVSGFFIRIYERNQNLQPVAIWCTGRSIQKAIYFFQRLLVISLVVDRFNFHMSYP